MRFWTGLFKTLTGTPKRQIDEILVSDSPGLKSARLITNGDILHARALALRGENLGLEQVINFTGIPTGY